MTNLHVFTKKLAQFHTVFSKMEKFLSNAVSPVTGRMVIRTILNLKWVRLELPNGHLLSHSVMQRLKYIQQFIAHLTVPTIKPSKPYRAIAYFH